MEHSRDFRRGVAHAAATTRLGRFLPRRQGVVAMAGHWRRGADIPYSLPMLPTKTLRIGTRGSRLALWQAQHARALLQRAWPGLDTELVVIRSQGDRQAGAVVPPPGGGFFTAALSEALRDGEVDLAVHSLKDLPTAPQPGLAIGAIPRRGAVADVLVSRDGLALARLAMGSVIGTGSPRRVAQLRHHRPDLEFVPVRGNVHTRVRRLQEADSPCDALVLAEAGLVRLGLESCISERLSPDLMLPAPGQGALALQCRDEDSPLRLLGPLDHAPTRQAVNAERSFLAGLASGCSAPVASLATVDDERLQLRGRVLALEGSRMIELALEESRGNEEALGQRMAQLALQKGAASLVAGP